jgi:translation initiation factor 1
MSVPTLIPISLGLPDPFQDERDPGTNASEDYIHIRIQQRNGRKTLTTIQGIPKRACIAITLIFAPIVTDSVEYDLKKLLQAFKKVEFPSLVLSLLSLDSWTNFTPKDFACNGTLIKDPDMGDIIQLQGDQRSKVFNFLTEEGIPKNSIKVHGF